MTTLVWCSTPTGIKVIFRSNLLELATCSFARAQRLTASKLYSEERKVQKMAFFIMCSTPNGIKVIFRRNVSPNHFTFNQCSTPNGIKVIFSVESSTKGSKLISAQRLTASKLYSEHFI